MRKPARQGIMAQVISRMSATETLINDRHAESMMIGLLAEAERVEDGDAAWKDTRIEVAAQWGADLEEPENRKPFIYRDGVAVIPVHGLLINRFPYCWGFVTGYDFIRRQMNLALDDSDVQVIVFDHDSPGGEAAGCDELAREIFAARGRKPTMAMVNSLSASASFWVACPCDRVVAAPSSTVGSIGVYIQHWNMAKMLADYGLETQYIQAGEFKTSGNAFSELSKKDRAYLQQMVDERYDEFVAAVAEFRGIEESVARDTEARVMRPPEAIALGLIDAAVSPATAVSDFLAELGYESSNAPEEDDEMAETEINSEALAAARIAERQRISAITNHAEAAGRKDLATFLAHETDNSVEAAAAILAASPKVEDAKPVEGDKGDDGKEKPAGEGDKGDDGKEKPAGEEAKGSPFVEAMNKDKHPEVGANGGGGDGDETSAKVNAILAAQEAATGRKLRQA